MTTHQQRQRLPATACASGGRHPSALAALVWVLEGRSNRLGAAPSGSAPHQGSRSAQPHPVHRSEQYAVIGSNNGSWPHLWQP
jgi:hypothetical protein